MAALALALAACRSTPEPPPFGPPEGLELRLEAYAGSLLGGVLPRPAAVTELGEPGQALSVLCEVYLVERLPRAGVEPLASVTRFVASIADDEPIIPASKLLRGAAVADGEAAVALRDALRAEHFGRAIELQGFATALPPGVTLAIYGARVEPREGDSAELASRPAEARLGLLVARRPAPRQDTLELALGQRDAAPLDREVLGDEPGRARQAAGSGILRQELALLPDAELADGRLVRAFVVPSSFEQLPDAAFVAVIEVAPAPDAIEEPAAWAAHLSAFERCVEQVAAASERAVAEAQFTDRDSVLAAAMWQVLVDLSAEDFDRRALLPLARRAGARLAADLIATVDDAFLTGYAALLNEAVDATPPGARDEAALSWLLERVAWDYLADSLLASQVAPELESVAVRYAGEAARFPSLLQDAARTSADLESFELLVLEENYGFLRDPAPAARVRAFEWLERQGRAPAGYDPLGPDAERREALERFAAELEAAPGGAEERP